MDYMTVLACKYIRSFRLRTILACLVLNAAAAPAWCQTVPPATDNPNGTKSPAKKKEAAPWCMRHCDSSKEKAYDLNNQTYSGEIVRGPKTIVAKNLNIVRYDYVANTKVSFSQTPDLWGKLTGVASSPSKQSAAPPPDTAKPKTTTPSALAPAAPNPAGGKAIASTAGPSQAARAAVDQANKAIGDANAAINQVNVAIAGINNPVLDQEIADSFTSLQSQVKTAKQSTKQVADAGQELLSFVRAAEPSTMQSNIEKELANDSTYMAGVKAPWADVNEVARLKESADLMKVQIANLKSSLDSSRPSLTFDLKTAGQYLTAASGVLDQKLKELKTPADQTALSDAESRAGAASLELQKANLALNAATARVQTLASDIDEMTTALAALDTSSDAYKSFQQAQAKLDDWKQRLEVLKQLWQNHANNPDEYSDPTTMRIAGTCDYAFASTKQTAVKLTAIDQLPDKSAASPSDVLSVTIECASPFNVSAGVEFSTVPYNQFAIQPVATPPGSTTTTNEFVYTTHSNFHPLPIAMVSTRLYEPNEKFSIHASFGLSGNFNSDSNGGSSAEFLFGPSIALFRTMFITPGLHIGRESTLANGFSVGNPAPPNVTTPPVQISYKPGFGLAITFTKP
jgi:hypothetical protein